MSEALHFLFFFLIVAIALLLIFTLVKNAFLKSRHIYINNMADLSKHYFRYLLYFWAVGIFVPFSELLIELFSVRKESELTYNIFVGLFCLGIAFLSRYSLKIRDNLHRLFSVFFAVYNLLILIKIASNGEMDFLTLAEFTLVNLISYYVFYSLRYFYIYFLVIFSFLGTIAYTEIISNKDFIIYFNSLFIAFVINYVIHYIDLNIKENLFFAYNFVNRGNLLVFGVNRNGTVTYVSDNINEFLEYSSEDLIGKNWETEVKEGIGFEKNEIEKILKVKTKENNYKFYDWHEEIYNDDLILKVGRDVTYIKKTESQLINTNSRLNALLANIGDLVFVLNLDYMFTNFYQSENHEDLMMHPSLFLGKNIEEVGLPEDTLLILKEAIGNTFLTHKKNIAEYSLINFEGKRQWYSVIVSPLDDQTGNLSEIICIARNVTDNKKAQIELQRTKEILEQASRVAKVGGWEYNLSKKRVFSSNITKEIFEIFDNSELDINQVFNFFEIGHARNELILAFEKCIKDGIPFDLELPIVTNNEKKLWVRAKGTAEFVDGACKRIYGIVQDIDENVKSKKALKQSEEKFRYISENISDVVIVFEGDSVAYLSPTHQQQFGYSAEEAIEIAQRNIYDFFHPDDHSYIENLYCDAIEDKLPKITYTIRFLHKNGSFIWREDSVTLIYNAEGDLIMRLVTARDVSERKNQELAIQLMQERVLLQNKILIQLAHTRLDLNDFWKEGLQTITELTSEGIDTERVSVWLYNENQLSCIDLFLRGINEHTISDVIKEEIFPNYFKGIKSEMAIIANDAHSHIHTQELSEPYLKPANIMSILDLPIFLGGKLVGVICCEQTKEIKNWTDADVKFIRSIADIISLGIEADKRLKAEKELKRTKEILEQTSQVAKVGAWEIDIINQTVFFSDINKGIIEAPLEFVLNLETALSFFKEGESRNKVSDSFNDCFKKGISFDIEVQVVTLKGRERWLRAMGQAEFENGKCNRIFGTFQDIDKQVKLIQQIKDKELQYRSLLSNISSVTFRSLNDASLTMIFVSDFIKELTGYPAQEFLMNKKRSFVDIVYPEDMKIFNANFTEKEKEFSIEYRIVNVNNEIIWVNEKGRWYYDEVEDKVMLDGIISNITERKLAEIALVKSYEELKNTQKQLLSIQLEQEKFVNLVKYSEAFIGMTDIEGNIIFLNEKAKVISGIGDDFKGFTVNDFLTDTNRLFFATSILPQVLNNGMWQGEQELISPKFKNILFTDATIFLIRDPLTHRAIAFATIQIDISERKKAEAKLFENQKELLHKSELLAAIAKTTEKLLVSKNIYETLQDIFKIIGESIGADRVYYFEKDFKTNLVSQKVEWVREGISSQIKNPDTQNLSIEEYSFFSKPLLQNKIFQMIISDIKDEGIIEFWKKQDILSMLLLPIFIKDKFYGMIGFDDCTYEQIWSDDKINILLSLATNIANAVERFNYELIISESESNFRQLTETLEDVFLLFDVKENRYIYVSPSCEEVLGPDQAYFYEKNNFAKDFLFEEDHNINQIIEEQIKNQNSSEVEYKIKTKEGNEKWISQKSFGIKNESGDLVRISGICSDITEQKIFQNKIKQLSLVAEKITNGVVISDKNGCVLWANQGFLDMMEIELDLLIGKRPSNLFNPQFKDAQSEIDMRNSYNFNIELEIETYKKTKKWIEIINTGIKDDQGEFIQQIEVVIDISERKKAENLLIESEGRFRFIAENTSDGIFVIENTRIIYTSPSFQRMFGYSFEESYLQSEGNLLDFVHPDDVESFRKSIHFNTSQKIENFVIQYRTHHKDGHFIWREDTMTAFYQGDKAIRFICVVRDITERKKAEEQLRESERKLSNILNALDEIVWAVNIEDYKLILVSKSFEKVYGKKSNEWKSNFNLWKDVIIPKDVAIAKKMELEVFSKGQAYGTFRIFDALGNIKWLENIVKMVKNEVGEPIMIMGVTTDITDKKIAEKALKVAQTEADEAIKSKAELELRALQMQMNPHFVFNALNSIQSYIMTQDTLTANLYLSKFSRLIRLFLESSRSKFIPLVEEIKLVTLYVELEKIRFDDKFDFEIVVDANVDKNIEIPTMILQPFIENAINHGLRYKRKKGLLSIKFFKEKGFLICVIEDDGVGRRISANIKEKSSKGYKSQGLKITTERLMTYNKINNANIVFSIKDRLEHLVGPSEDVGTVIEIRFPEN
jgi:PAS domain S-box-containing protein